MASIVSSGGFNTGRLYSKPGQRIWWAQRSDGWLYFFDQDRLINGWIDRRGTPSPMLAKPVLEGWLMTKYDQGAYLMPGDRETPGMTGPTPPADLDYGPPLGI